MYPHVLSYRIDSCSNRKFNFIYPGLACACCIHACILGRMRAGQSERLASETADEREATLERMRADHSERLASETVEEREARLERTRTIKLK